MTRYIWLVLSAFVITGCQSPMVWNRPGATEAEFNSERYRCSAESQQQSSSAYVGKYGGFASSGQTTNEPLYNACMTARGWSLQKQTITPEVQAALKTNLQTTQQKVCGNPEFAPYYTKTACVITDITFAQLADTSRISPEVKTIFIELRRALEAQQRESLEILRKSSTAGAKRADLWIESFKAPNDKNSLDLYNGAITWGEYNRRRQELYKEYATAAARITS